MSLVDSMIPISEPLTTADKTPTRPGRPKKRSLEEAARSEKPSRKATTPMPCSDIWYDEMGHWPQPSESEHGCCRHCADGYSKIYCSK